MNTFFKILIACVFIECFVVKIIFTATTTTASANSCLSRHNLGLRRKDAPRLIPECDEAGNFKTLHCFTENGKNYCQCWAKNGDLIKGPSNTTKSCDCLLARHEADKKKRSGSIGHHTPRCEADGFYSKKQCHASTGFCWCSNAAGEKVTGSEARSRNISCS